MDEKNNDTENKLTNEIEEVSYKTLFKELIEGFALHEIVCDENGKPINYRFLDVNPAFEKMVGVRRLDVLGKLVLDVMPDTEAFWIDTYGNVALTGNSIIFEHFSRHLNKSYQVTSFSPKKGQFVTLFEDISSRKEAEDKLNTALADSKKINEIMVGREIKMIELKDRVRELELKIEELENKLSISK